MVNNFTQGNEQKLGLCERKTWACPRILQSFECVSKVAPAILEKNWLRKPLVQMDLLRVCFHRAFRKTARCSSGYEISFSGIPSAPWSRQIASDADPNDFWGPITFRRIWESCGHEKYGAAQAGRVSIADVKYSSLKWGNKINSY